MRPTTPIDIRLWSRVDKNTASGCWEWQGPLHETGYGLIGAGGRGGAILRTHRVSYELLVGPIPEDLHLDHLCKNRKCCNPDHLEAVTQAENNRRAFEDHTHCPRGHVLPPKTPPGVRRPQCKTCKSEYDRNRHIGRKAA